MTITTNGFEQFINPQKINLEHLTMDGIEQPGWIFSLWDEQRQEYNFYRTNRYGEGLWVIVGRDYRQLYGTTEYELPKDRKRAYQKIYYEWFVKQ